MSQSKKITIPIKGMHCRSCELLIESELAAVPGVDRVRISYKEGKAEIFHSDEFPNAGHIDAAIRQAGYSIGESKKLPWLSRNFADYANLGWAVVFAYAVYWIFQNTTLSNLSISSWLENPSNLGVVALIGLAAGFSTCMALVGGLVLGMAGRHAELHPEATTSEKFQPHLYFNAGRIAGYGVLGGVLGLAGSALQLSPGVTGLLTIAVGGVMLLLGLQLTELFPKLAHWKLTLPKFISRAVGIHNDREYSNRGAMMLGALTFFLPCGFTQAMQLLAIESGSPLRGAFIMAVFAIGTAPGLLGIGGVMSSVKGMFAKKFFAFAGVVVVLLAAFNITNGMRLISVGQAKVSNEIQADDVSPSAQDAQVIRMAESSGGYTPNSFTVKKGVPVRWVIDAQDPYSCASSIIVPKLNIRKTLKRGENIVEFTPTETGKIPFSCSMGMYTGSFTVIGGDIKADSPGASASVGSAKPSASNYAPAPSRGGGCHGGGSPSAGSFTDGAVKVTKDPNGNDVQVIKTTYTYETDIQPNSFQVKKGVSVHFEIDARDNGAGCMNTIIIPGIYDDAQFIEKGKTITMDFTPQTVGEYPITCRMGMQRGVLIVR